MRSNMNTSKPTITLALFCLMLFGLLVFVAACGSSSTTTGSASSTSTTTQNASATSTDTSGNGYGGGGGRYGGGANTTPTPTTAVTGPSQTVMITTNSSGTFTFSPKSLTIAVGTTVIWKNMTHTPHTVTSDDGKSFNTGETSPVAPGTTFSFKFTTAGTFAYHCDFHPFMTATIIVQ